MNTLDFFLSIIENPRNQKAYNDLKNYYQTADPHVAEALNHLIQKKFDAPHNSPPNTESLENN